MKISVTGTGLRLVVMGCVAAGILSMGLPAQGANRAKANNTSNLNTTASWVGATLPGLADVGVWSNTVTTANDVLLGGDVSWGGMAVYNPGGAVSVSGSNNLTLGVFGIDMARAMQPLTLSPAQLTLITNASVSLSVSNGMSLTLNPTNFVRLNGALLVITNVGTVATATITNDVTGIVGTWARYGLGAGARYATVSGGVITGYVGTAAASAADVVDAGGTTNYDVAAVGVLGAGASFNTLRYTGAAGGIGGDLMANGLMNAGAGALSFSNNVTIGANKELVLVSPDTTRTLTMSGQIVDNGGGASGVTIAGGGRVNLSASNSYSGVTAIAAGIAGVTNADALGSTSGNTTIHSTGMVGNNGGQLSLSGGVTIAEPILIQGPGDGAFAALYPANQYIRAIDSTSGTNTVTGPITLTGGTSYRLGASAGTIYYGLIQRSTTGGGNLIIDPNIGSTVNVYVAMDNNLGQLTCHGGGMVIFSASGNDIGQSVVQNLTTLRITAPDVLPTNQNVNIGQGAGNTAANTNNDVGTFIMDANQTINALIAYSNNNGSASATDKRKVTSTSSNALTLTIGNGNTSGSFDGIIENGSNGATIAITKVGTGAQSFTGGRANTYTGVTTVNGGTLLLNKLVGTNAIAGNIVIGAGVVTNVQSHQIVDTATVTLTTNTSQWGLNGTTDTVANVDVQNAAATPSGLMTGTGGKLTVSGTLTHTLGGITLNSGGAGGTIDANSVINTGGAWVFGTSSGATQSLLVGSGGLTVGGGSTIQLDSAASAPNFIGLGGDVVSLSNAVVNTISGGGQLRLNGSRTFDVNDGVAFIDMAVATPIADGTSAGSLTKTGLGVLQLSGTNIYTGTTTINAGVLTIGTTNALPGWSVPASYSVAAGATLAVGNGVNDAAIGTILGTGNLAAGAMIGFDTTLGNRTYASNIVDTGAGALGVAKIGANTLTLSGTNTYTGMTIVNAGYLTIASTNALPGWDVNGRYFVASNAAIAVANAVANADVATMIATTNFAAGAMIGFDTSTGNRTFSNTIANTANGALGVAKIGTNNLTVTGTNTYDGITRIERGGLQINNASALGTTNGGTIINHMGSNTNGGWLTISGGITLAEPITIAGTGDGAPNYYSSITVAGGGGTNTLTGPIIVTAPSTRITAGGANTMLIIDTSITRTSGTPSLTLGANGAGGFVVVNKPINTGGPLQFHNGPGTIIINAGTNNIGPTAVQYQHLLKLGIGEALATNQNLQVGANPSWGSFDGERGTVDLNGFNQTVNGLIGNGTNTAAPPGTRIITNSNATLSTLTVGNANGSAVFNGQIEGNVALTKVGAGTQTLCGTNLFTGPTIVSNGTLALTGNCALASTTIAIGTGARLAVTGRVDGILALASGQTLRGNGTVAGTVNNGGTVAPGASPGTLTVAGDYVQTGSLEIEVGGTVAGTAHDQLVVSNAVALTGNLTVILTNSYVPVMDDAMTILTSAGGITGTFDTTNLPSAGAGLSWDVQYSNNLVRLVVVSATPLTGFDLYAHQITNIALRGPQADPDGDGYMNLLEYATGGNPTNIDTVSRMAGLRTNNVLALKFTRDTNAVDVTYIVEASASVTNDATWQIVGVNSNGVWDGDAAFTESTATNPVSVTVEDNDAFGLIRFMRLRLTRP